MKQVLQNVRSGDLEVADVPDPACKSGGVLVRNAASLISAGTEKMLIDFGGKSLLGKARERPDLVKQVLGKVRKDGLAPTLQAVFSRLDQPFPLGYSCAGVVEEVGRGAEEFRVGDRVACAGMGYASHAETIFVPRNLTVPIPDEVSFDDAAYVTLGAIALQGVRRADVRLGENVAVIGLGLLGQLSVQILKAAGARVLAVDLDPAKVALAKELGADAAVLRSDDVLGAVAAFSDGVGMDSVLIAAATTSNDPIELAAEISRDRASTTIVGAVKMDVPRKPFYDKELDLRLSRSYGPGRYDPEYEERGRDYPIAYVRWTERRNMQEFLNLIASGKVTTSGLTTHRFDIADAEQGYDVITGKLKEPFAGVLLTYSQQHATSRRIELPSRERMEGSVGIGFIGAGNFARSVLLPAFRTVRHVDLVGISTATGLNSRAVGDKFGFRYCTTDTSALLSDPDISAVVVATRHDSHAAFTIAALKAGKSVFVEKPLALSEAELQRVTDAVAETGGMVTVGFNRRFSPLAVQMREVFPSGQALAINYRVNAGPIPADHWVHHPEEGGGRIIGEACHFVDLCTFLADDVPEEVFAHGLGGQDGVTNDTVTVTLRFRRGSVASISYVSTGDPSFSKERVEVFGNGTVAVLEDFRSLTVSRDGKVSRTRPRSQAKGFGEELTAFVEAVRGGDPPVPFQSLVHSMRATFAIETSLRTGMPVPVLPEP